MKAVKEQFNPLARTLRIVKAAAAMKVEVRPQAPEATDSTAATNSTEKDGDVTKDLADGMSASEKQKLVRDLNAQALKERAAQLQCAMCEQAAALLRNRLVVVRRASDAKTFMQTSSQGLVARTIIVDVSMPADRQSGRKSRSICMVPTETFLKEKADEIATIPASPIIGHVLIRSCHHDVEALHKGLEATHAHRRMICVPIDVPTAYQRYLNSAASRSFGPQEDHEKSGVDFTMRTNDIAYDKPLHVFQIVSTYFFLQRCEKPGLAPPVSSS